MEFPLLCTQRTERAVKVPGKSEAKLMSNRRMVLVAHKAQALSCTTVAANLDLQVPVLCSPSAAGHGVPPV